MGNCLAKCLGKESGGTEIPVRGSQYNVARNDHGTEGRRPAASSAAPQRNHLAKPSSSSLGNTFTAATKSSSSKHVADNKEAQRLETSRKTGVFAVQNEQGFQLTSAVTSIDTLRTLHLENVGLKDLPPLSGLVNLQRLKLPRNLLTSIPPLTALINLQQIDLSKNQLSSLPDSFGGLERLKEANLSGNNLASLPASLGSCNSLKTLDASSNKLTSLPSTFGKLWALEDLILSNNMLSKLPSSLEQLPRIKRIQVQNNSLSTLPSGLLKNTPLVDINFSGNSIKDPESIEGYDKFLERNNRKANQIVDQKVKAGDLSSGLGPGGL